MTLALTSATSTREPGFSRSECLELARRIDRNDTVGAGLRECCEKCGRDSIRHLSFRQRNTIVAALRAYADV